MIDFARKKLHYADPQSGEQIACEVFVAVLPFSGYLLRGSRSFPALGGFFRHYRQRLCIPGGRSASGADRQSEERCNQAVSLRTDPDGFARTTQRPLRLHVYGCPGVARPRDKASVERHVQIVYQRVYAPLRNETFTSLQGLNDAILGCLSAHHALPFQQRHNECLRSLFDSLERPILRPLPASEVKHSARYKVQQNYHVQLGRDRHFYSVPHEHIGKQVQVIYTRHTVEIYDGHRRIAFHPARPSAQCLHHSGRTHAAQSPALHQNQGLFRSILPGTCPSNRPGLRGSSRAHPGHQNLPTTNLPLLPEAAAPGRQILTRTPRTHLCTGPARP